MNFNDNFSRNELEQYLPVFRQQRVPIFQNKVYPSYAEARAADAGEVELVQSPVSGFVFNKAFTPQVMNYDVHYQNEQSNSLFFQQHLRDVLQLLQSFGMTEKKVVEVGCGKGIFFEMMLKEGINCWGFDPTYEGDNPRIKKVYFDESQKGIAADIIVMRHTLEHIPQPFSFLHTIAKANDFKGHLFVEVPAFDWIVKKNAFWDIFYEHCNYFTEESLQCMFHHCHTGNFFGGQYIYLWAPFDQLRDIIPGDISFTRKTNLTFDTTIANYQRILAGDNSLAIWGAGAKGSTFLNLLDPDGKSVQYVIDINPAKQHRFIAGTGHRICPPEILHQEPVSNIIIMNENYAVEIAEQLRQWNMDIQLTSL